MTESLDPLARAYESLPLPLVIFQRDGRVQGVNAASRRLLGEVGVDVDALVGSRWQEQFPQLAGTVFAATFEELRSVPSSEADPAHRSLTYWSADTESWWEVDLWVGPDDRIHGMFRALPPAEGETKAFAHLLGAFPFGAAVLFDHDLRYVAATGQGLDEVDLVPEELIGRTARELWPEETLEGVEGAFRAAIGGESSEVEVPYAGRTYRVWAGPNRDRSGRLIGGMALTQEVTAEVRVRRELQLLRRAVDDVPAGITVTAAADDQPLIFVSDGFEELTGYSRREILGENCRFLQGPGTDPEHVEQIRRGLGANEPVQITLRNYRKDGSEFWNRLSIAPVRDRDGRLTHFIGIQEDVTEHRRMGLEIETQRKLAALGQLAGGIAHDLRNTLTSAGLLLDLALDGSVELEEPLRRDLEEAQTVLTRGEAVTRRLLAFARENTEEAAPMELRAFLEGRATILRKLIRESVEVEVELPDRPVWIEANEGQLDQALMNLAKNAEQAMEGAGVLRLALETEVEPSTVPSAQAGDMDLGGTSDWIRVTVEDTGCGIREEDRRRAFDPFFSTRADEGGSGLGLSSVHGTVSGLGGACWLESEVGVGTAVHMVFPETHSSEADTDEAPPTRSSASGRKVLLVEDDDPLRRSCRRILERLGCEVLEAPDSETGRELLTHHNGDTDLLITDAVLPGGESGVSLIRYARDERPDLPILLISGYTAEEVDPNELGVRFMSKPFRIDDFVDAIQELLARTDGSAGSTS